MNLPGFTAEATVGESRSSFVIGARRNSANAMALVPAVSGECIDQVMHMSEMSYADAVWWCDGYETGGGGGGGGDEGPPSCMPACSICQIDYSSPTGYSHYCTDGACNSYTVNCEYGEV